MLAQDSMHLLMEVQHICSLGFQELFIEVFLLILFLFHVHNCSFNRIFFKRRIYSQFSTHVIAELIPNTNRWFEISVLTDNDLLLLLKVEKNGRPPFTWSTVVQVLRDTNKYLPRTSHHF